MTYNTVKYVLASNQNKQSIFLHQHLQQDEHGAGLGERKREVCAGGGGIVAGESNRVSHGNDLGAHMEAQKQAHYLFL